MEGYPPEPPAREPGTVPIPWEVPGRPFLAAIMETTRLFVTSPTEAFRRVPVTSELFRPLLYAVLLGWLGAIFNAIYELVFSVTLWQFLPGFNEKSNVFMETTGHIITMFVTPLLILIGVFIWSAITHLVLMMLGGAGAGFQATARVQCYALTSSLAQIIPIGGGLVTAVWSLALQVIGLAEIHQVTRGKAAMAVLLPFGLCCICWIIVMVVAGAGMLAALMGSG